MHTVLIVDDSDFLRVAIRNLLEKHGFTVVGEAHNGKVGLDMYKELRPNAVVMDVTMEEMDGITACGEINKFDPGAVVVVLSAIVGQKEHQEAALKNGARAILQKPFGMKRLHEVIKECLQPHEDEVSTTVPEEEIVEDIKYLAEQMAIIKMACTNEREIYAYEALTGLRDRQWLPRTENHINRIRRMIYKEGDFKAAARVVDTMLEMLTAQ
ncbi:MAG: response regulator [Defluviitaleaceae bacterium]|nr:response regulator [Defluviitaleaceae bacterium]MCL2275373.1 response regulator [Defluviitaleaceae bacterium]